MLKASQLAKIAARAAEEKNAEDILVLNVAQLLVVTDFFIICTGSSTRQVRAIADNVREKLAAKGRKPFSVEGKDKLQWVLLDYSDLIVHIFDKPTRDYYQLERLWIDAPSLDWAVKPAKKK